MAKSNALELTGPLIDHLSGLGYLDSGLIPPDAELLSLPAFSGFCQNHGLPTKDMIDAIHAIEEMGWATAYNVQINTHL